jgi:hypothetical protein
MKTAPASFRRPASIAIYRAILRLYPRAFRRRWAGETLELFVELARRQPNGLALWAGHLPDLVGGLLAEWWRECGSAERGWRPVLFHGTLAGALLSGTTITGDLGQLWSTPSGRLISWVITAAALTVMSLAGRSRATVPLTLRRALRNGCVSGLIGFSAANLTAGIIVLTCLDRLHQSAVQVAAFAASHESSFRAYQIHELLGGWTYGSLAGALLGTAGAGIAATVSRRTHRHRSDSAA